MDIKWESRAQEVFDKVIGNLPQFHRNIAKQLVKERAQELAKEGGSEVVREKDLIIAFFQEIPPAFKEMMKRLFHNLDIDYSQFVKEENQPESKDSL